MAYWFNNRISQADLVLTNLQHLGAKLRPEDLARLRLQKHNWDMFEGYHWQDMGMDDKPQVTTNYCRAFVNKFVAFEFGNGFSITMNPDVEDLEANNPLTFLNSVWESNNKIKKCVELGQSKSVTGEGWIQVLYEPKYLDNGALNPDFKDPFDEYVKGRIRLLVVPASICFPEYEEGYDKDRLKKLVIQYPVEIKGGTILNGNKARVTMFRIEIDDKTITQYKGDQLIKVEDNKYKFIPFVKFDNYPFQGRTVGMNDLDDIIPLNIEYNIKSSDISEIIDYHSAPVTVVFGARVGQLERGANKVWGGLPKDAKVENLRLEGDLTAAQDYLDTLRYSMYEVGNVPKGALGGDLAISNTSGIALQIALMPLTERVKIKHVCDAEGISLVNKMILKIALEEGLIDKPEDISNIDFFYNNILFEDVLPKDEVIELQAIETEMRNGLTCREYALKKLGRDNIKYRLKEIDKEREAHPELYGIEQQTNKDGDLKQINSGLTNSPEPKDKFKSEPKI